jgi:glucosamine-phosphate N-acetyltransferase
MNNNLYIRELNKYDYSDYLDLMFEFTNYKHNISKIDFEKEIDNMNCNINNKKILVIIYNEKLIGSGTIFKLNKLHNNPVGQIEDVIIRNELRGKGFGKLIINKLVEIGLNDYGCYKIILNCLEKNIGFYENCGFENIGFEMKYKKL